MNQPQKEVKELSAQDFATKYQELVKETGFQILAQPVWVATNHGSFEMTLQYQVAKMPKQEEK
jgi:hypothetical protein